jgi:hypothetical protein
MNYVIFATALWVIFFATGTFILHKKYGSLKKASFIRTFRGLGMLCLFLVFLVMVIIKVLM